MNVLIYGLFTGRAVVNEVHQESSGCNMIEYDAMLYNLLIFYTHIVSIKEGRLLILIRDQPILYY